MLGVGKFWGVFIEADVNFFGFPVVKFFILIQLVFLSIFVAFRCILEGVLAV